MAKKNDNFFIEKKAWSIVKDELLGCYLKPYVSKILTTNKPLLYVDCFAGKGKFEDGNLGSPLIALNIINRCQSKTKMNRTSVEPIFIDLNHADDLQKNLISFPHAKIISGNYEDNIHNILRGKNGYNVFLYIDPYGIKALQCTMFDEFAKGNFYSIELLINMNSFGFIREACHAMGTKFDDKDIFDDLIEYEPTELVASIKSVNELNKIAGGDYWQEIIAAYKKKEIDGYEAETKFAVKYCMRLRANYTYVLNMPLRIKKGQRPKYRLIHATNHRDGCLLMVDNIRARWELLQTIQTNKQLPLYPETLDNEIINDCDIRKLTIEHFSEYTNWNSLHDVLASYFTKYGPICGTKVVKNIIKQLEDGGKLSIIRNPDVTDKGKPSRFMSEDSKQTVFVRWCI